MAVEEEQGPTTTDSDAIARTISQGIVCIYAEFYGRGPTRSTTHVSDDYVMTVLDESFTIADRTLIKAGNARQVEETRRAFQEAVRDRFVELVESATGREVRIFMSQVDVESETAVELFLLK